MEAFIIALVAMVGFSFFAEMIFAQPQLGEVVKGFVPSLPDSDALYIAIGIIGATVMPHNLYLHSALVQTRKIGHLHTDIKRAIKFNFFLYCWLVCFGVVKPMMSKNWKKCWKIRLKGISDHQPRLRNINK